MFTCTFVCTCTCMCVRVWVHVKACKRVFVQGFGERVFVYWNFHRVFLGCLRLSCLHSKIMHAQYFVALGKP